MRHTFGYKSEPDRWFEWEGGNTATLYTDYGMQHEEVYLDTSRDPDLNEVSDACYDMLDDMKAEEQQ